MNEPAEAFAEIERGVTAALETYSNVHRGSGHNSLVSTQLYSTPTFAPIWNAVCQTWRQSSKIQQARAQARLGDEPSVRKTNSSVAVGKNVIRKVISIGLG